MTDEEKIEPVETSNWKVRLANRLLAEKDERTSDMILQRLMRIHHPHFSFIMLRCW